MFLLSSLVVAMPELTSGVHCLDLPLNSRQRHRALAAWERRLRLTTVGPFSGFGRHNWVLASSNRHLRIAASSISDKKRTVEKLWQEFFSDPSLWWDHRFQKQNARFPDFKHKETQESLWVDGKLNPPWVEIELAAMAPGTVQVHIFSWNKRLANFVKAGENEKALELFQHMQCVGMNPDKFTFTPLLNACASLQVLDEGRRMHEHIVKSGFESDVYVSASLIDMYAKCGSIEDAEIVFNKIPIHNVVSWNTMISANVRYGQGQKVLELFSQMRREEVDPDSVTFVGVLNACANDCMLEEGRAVHLLINGAGFASVVFVGNSLIDMYAKCGSIEDAWAVFNSMPMRDVVTWSAMIRGYVRCGQGQKALELSRKMQQEDVEPDHVTFVGMLNACASVGALDEGRHIHEEISERGFESIVVVGSSLVDMYVKCGSLGDAWRVFTRMPMRNVVCWNALILGHVRSGEGQKALQLFQKMELEGLDPDPITFVGVVNACASVAAIEEGRDIHTKIARRGYEGDVFVASSLIDMYAKCGAIGDAWGVFNQICRTGNVVCWNAMLVGLVNCGKGRKALKLFQEMEREGLEPVPATYVGVLRACAGEEALTEGRRVHELIIKKNYEFEAFVSSSLVNMYAKCGSVSDALQVFADMPTRDVVSWNALILGYVKSGQGEKALELARRMERERMEPDGQTFVGVLNACASVLAVEEGRRVHGQIIQRGLESDVFVGSSLVKMYVKCGSLLEACSVFNKMPTRDVVAWSAMLQGYVKCGQGQKALELSLQMELEGVEPDAVSFVGMLNACASVAAFQQGKCIHEQIIRRGFGFDAFVGSSLVDMYVKCGSLEDAWKVFTQLPARSVVAWNAMILGHVKCGQGKKALELSDQMQLEGLEPVAFTFVGLLNACASLGALDEGRRVHKRVIHCGYGSEVVVCNSLIDMYGKCRSIEDAVKVFSKMPIRDVVSWNTMILGHVNCKQGKEALCLYDDMQQQGVEALPLTFVGVLKACASLGALEEGRLIHERIICYGYEFDLFVCSSLVDMYAKCGSIEDARSVFNEMPTRDVVIWSAMIQGYVNCGLGHKALELFQHMQLEGVAPSPTLLVGLVHACAGVKILEEGRRIHDLIIQKGCECDTLVGNSLIDMYAKCGSIKDAQRVFSNMHTRDVVGWGTIIQGYVKCGQGREALQLFRQMRHEGVEPDRLSFVSCLNACASVVALEDGRSVHEHIIQRGWESDLFVSTSLVDMYAKCGSIEDARRVFNRMPARDVVSWNTMLRGYAMHGLSKETLEHFRLMSQEGVESDTISFLALLSACSHAGLVDEGLDYFESMTAVHQISATVKHYACIVDLLGRAGRLREAEVLINLMAFEPDAGLWMSLLGACKVHQNIEIGQRVAERVFELDPQNAAGFVLLPNIYVAAGKWDISEYLRVQ